MATKKPNPFTKKPKDKKDAPKGKMPFVPFGKKKAC